MMVEPHRIRGSDAKRGILSDKSANQQLLDRLAACARAIADAIEYILTVRGRLSIDPMSTKRIGNRLKLAGTLEQPNLVKPE